MFVSCLPVWCCLEMVETLERGAVWEILRSLMGCVSSEKIVETQFSLLACCYFLSHIHLCLDLTVFRELSTELG